MAVLAKYKSKQESSFMHVSFHTPVTGIQVCQLLERPNSKIKENRKLYLTETIDSVATGAYVGHILSPILFIR